MSLLTIVDDEETTRELCATVATQAGLRAAGVASSERALEYLEQSPVDIVIADLKLPGMSGLDLLKRIRGTLAPTTETTPIPAETSSPQETAHPPRIRRSTQKSARCNSSDIRR